MTASEIKRYDLKSVWYGLTSSGSEMVEHPQGEWVRWDDVERFVNVLADTDSRSDDGGD